MAPEKPTTLRRLDQTVINFLQRVDSMTCVSTVHPIYFHKHPDDQFHTLDDIIDEINIPAPIEAVNPIRNTSKSGTIRNIVRYREEIVSLQNDHFSNYKYRLLWLNILGYLGIFTQLLRVPLTIITGSLALCVGLWVNGDGWDITTQYIITAIFTTLFLYLLYTLIFDDYMFAIWAFNWQDYVPNGVHCTSNELQHVGDNVEVLKQGDPKNYYQTGDWETLIPAIRGDTIQTKQQYIRRWIQSSTDNEWIAVDIAFPWDDEKQCFVHDNTKHIVVLLHGMNGSSYAPYIRANAEYHNTHGQHTVIAMTQRMMGNSILLGIETFNGVRTSDIWTAVAFAHLAAGNGVIDELKDENIKLKLANGHPLLNQNNLKQYGYNKNDIASYYQNLHEYQQILVHKRYTTWNQVFSSQKYANPMYIPDRFNEKDILTWRQANGYCPVHFVGYSMGGITAANYVTQLKEWTGIDSAVVFNAVSKQNGGLYHDFDGWLGPVVMGLVSKFSDGYEYILCDRPDIAERITNTEILRLRQRQDCNYTTFCAQTHHTMPDTCHFVERDMFFYCFFPKDMQYVDTDYIKQCCNGGGRFCDGLVNNNDKNNQEEESSSSLVVVVKEEGGCKKDDDLNLQHDENNNNNNNDIEEYRDDDNNNNTRSRTKYQQQGTVPTILPLLQQNTTGDNNNNIAKMNDTKQQQQQQKSIQKTQYNDNTLAQKYGVVDYTALYRCIEAYNRIKAKSTQYTFNKDYMISELNFRRFDDATARLTGYHNEPFVCPKTGKECLSMYGYYDQFGYAEYDKLLTLRTKLLVVHPQNDPVISVSAQYEAYRLVQAKKQHDEELIKKNKTPIKNGIDNFMLYIPRHGGHIGMWQSADDNFKTLSKISYDFFIAINKK